MRSTSIRATGVSDFVSVNMGWPPVCIMPMAAVVPKKRAKSVGSSFNSRSCGCAN